MKKNVSKILVSLMILTIALGLGACSQKKQSKYIGTWKATYGTNQDGDVVDLIDYNLAMTIILKDNGNATVFYDFKEYSEKWKETNNGISVTSGIYTVNFKIISESKIEAIESIRGITLYFEKQPDSTQEQQSALTQNKQSALTQNKQSEYVGTWKATSATAQDAPITLTDGLDMSMVLKADGSASLSLNFNQASGTWKTTDTGISASHYNRTFIFNKTDDGKLELVDLSTGAIIYFEKQPDSTQEQQSALTQNKQSKYIGTWKATSATAQGASIDTATYGIDMSIELKADGSASVSLGSKQGSCTWQETDKGISISSDGQTLTVNKTSDGKLELIDKSTGNKIYFEKQPN